MTEEDRAVLDTYERAARFYDLWAAAFERKVKRRCLALAADAERESILDVGVGTGDLFVELAAAHPDAALAGLDLSPSMLARAKAKLARAGAREGEHRLLLGDARALPFADGEFDLVVSTYLFELLPRDAYGVVVGELCRVARPGARIVVAGVVEHDAYRVARWLCRRNPAWEGGVDVAAFQRAITDAGGKVVSEELVVEKRIPACLLVAKR